jgi:thiamine biosynthesis lipoprotein
MITKFTLLLMLAMTAQQASSATTDVHVDTHIEGVLGTSLDISLYGSNEKQSQAAIKSLLKHINTLEDTLSTWRKNSEISQLNLVKSVTQLSPHLFNVLELCQQWEQTTHHFSCRMGQLTTRWEQAVSQQTMPDRIQLRRLARDISKQPLANLNNQQGITIPTLVTYDISAIAKGYILDNSVQFLRLQLPQLSGIKLNIGGDIITWGTKAKSKKWKISIMPHNAMSDNNTQKTIEIVEGAIAHSGVGERDFVINRRQFNHIMMPKEGWPLDSPHTATVSAPDATTADAIATALNTMDILKAIDWINTLDNVEALIQTPNGKAYSSTHWHRLIKQDKQAPPPAQLRIDYQIPDMKVDNYERPYLSIWLTDNNGKFVRQILLLGDANRWAQENKRWWRTVGRKHDGLLDAIARPTRRPGHYSVDWNGYNYDNQRVTNNALNLHIESSRENGGHNYQKTAINMDAKALITLPTKGEIGLTTITATH